MGHPECPNCGKRLVGHLEGVVDENDIISGGGSTTHIAVDCPECEAHLAFEVCIGPMGVTVKEDKS